MLFVFRSRTFTNEKTKLPCCQKRKTFERKKNFKKKIRRIINIRGRIYPCICSGTAFIINVGLILFFSIRTLKTVFHLGQKGQLPQSQSLFWGTKQLPLEHSKDIHMQGWTERSAGRGPVTVGTLAVLCISAPVLCPQRMHTKLSPALLAGSAVWKSGVSCPESSFDLSDPRPAIFCDTGCFACDLQGDSVELRQLSKRMTFGWEA